MQSISYQDLVDGEELQLLQNELCRVAGVYACCLNDKKESVTEMSHTGSGVFEGLSRDELQTLRFSPYTQRALERVEPEALEDTALERFPGGRVAAVAVRIEGRTLLYWLLFDCSNREEGKFGQVLDLVRDASTALYRYKTARLDAEMENRRCLARQQKMSRDLEQTEAVMSMVRLLDSDEQTQIVLEKWLRILGQYLRADSAAVFRLHRDERTMDLLGQWCNRGILSSFETTEGLDVCAMFRTDTPLVFSTGSIPGEHQWEADYYGWSAIMVFPIPIRESGENIVLAVDYRETCHNWEPAEIKFTADAVRMMQSILSRRMQKKSLEDSRAALETILDDVECGIYVADQKTKDMLFANRKLRSTFAARVQDGSFAAWVAQGSRKGQDGAAAEIFHEERARWYEMTCRETDWTDARRVLLYSFNDITDRKLYRRRAEQQAYTDILTGLRSRMCCERDLEGQIEEAEQTGLTGAVLALDLDGFRYINDSLGRSYGDLLLKSVAHALRRVEGLEDNCYRMDGDRFVVLIPPAAYRRIDRILSEIRGLFGRTWHLKDADYDCTASMGIATFPEAGARAVNLLQKADIAMRAAKKGGGNRLVEYSDALRT